jgi:hypothetical protein
MTVTLAEINRDDAIALRQDRKSKFLLYRELEAESRKEWLIGSLLGASDASAWYGVPGCGKSVLVEDMALHIAAGLDWHGRAVRQGAVLYIALERRKPVIRRAIAFRERHQIEDIPFAIVGGVYDLRTSQAVADIVQAVRQIEEETGQDVVLIVVDTLSRALCGGDENGPKDMGAIVAATSKLQAETKAHVLWVHHMPQDAERLRGHGALLGAMDTTVHVEKLSDVRTATVIKANDSEEGERVAFSLESVTIGPETTAPVVVAADPLMTKAATSKGRQRLSDRATLALKALNEAVLGHGRSAPNALNLPAGVRTVTINQWREEMFRQSVIARNHKNPKVAFDRVCDSLAAHSLIGLRDELVWLVSAAN